MALDGVQQVRLAHGFGENLVKPRLTQAVLVGIHGMSGEGQNRCVMSAACAFEFTNTNIGLIAVHHWHPNIH